MKKKKVNGFLKLLLVLFIIFIALYIANISGYYESKISERVVITENAIKEFESKVQNGEEVDVVSFLENQKEDYSNMVSNLGENVTSGLENIVSGGFGFVLEIIKSLF